MPFARLREPFKHPHWLFELKYDGFRALAVLDREGLCLVSRRGHVDGKVGALGEALRRQLGAPLTSGASFSPWRCRIGAGTPYMAQTARPFTGNRPH
ncbi:MAG: hypothetical protein HY271_17640 [Deltaproteobacteria bacterium]|nr:hypothetical protein [Deltaproteobacteria bacterium]